ncbi:MAG: class II fructose-bisphosphate aldolase [Trueperaceae bacterium]|nr:class II fructose-bisphosphate aldolase [Trueperaceae bacterium]
MPFVSDGRILIQRAFENNYAMPSFNVCSLEMARACVEAAEAEKAPIILQTYPGDLEQGSPKVMAGMIKALAEEASVPIMLHLDHGDSADRVAQCIRAGYSSVMFDGEEYALEENISRTRALADFVHAAGASIEAAAGSFGGGEGDHSEVHLTDPEVAEALLSRGGADMVACSVGSIHGQSSKLDIDRLEAIYKVAKKPLVLHGGSGIPAEDLAEAVKLGVVKVNIGAALFRALLGSWRQEAQGAEQHYPVMAAAREALREVAITKIQIMKASAKA